MPTNKFFEKWIDRARIISTEIDRDFRHISLVFDGPRLISIGTNQWKTHPRPKELGYLFDEPHSELAAYLKVPKDYSRSLTLINFRFNNKGQLRLAKPCNICTGWCVTLFKEIYYSDNFGNMIRL
jgi:hypothetical protein